MSKMKPIAIANSIKLAPCPKCAAQPDMMTWYIKGVANRKNYTVVCQNCGYRPKGQYKFNNIRRAASYWNEHFWGEKKGE